MKKLPYPGLFDTSILCQKNPVVKISDCVNILGVCSSLLITVVLFLSLSAFITLKELVKKCQCKIMKIIKTINIIREAL
jgi:hypothetical protein